MSEILNGPLAQAIGLALLHLLWQGAIVAGLLAATLSLLSRTSARVRYAISCAALALFLAFGVATAIRSYEPGVELPPMTANAAAVSEPFELTIIEPAVPAPTWRDDARAMTFAVQKHIPQIVLLWMAGVLLFTIRLTVSWNRARALATRLTGEAPAEWQVVIERLSKALNLCRPVKLLESAVIEVPSVIGWLRPVVLIPVSGLTGLTAQQIEMILAHELAHIRRHDFVVNVLQSVAETLLFYHPAAWWISNRIRIERENCCDDLAVSVCGNPLQYARALTQLEQMRAANATALAANGGSLLDRVRRLAGVDQRRGFVNGWTAAAAALSFVGLLAITTTPVNAQKKAEAPKAPKAAKASVAVEVPRPPAQPSPVAQPSPAPTPAPSITVMVPSMPNVNIAQAVIDGVEDAVDEVDLDDQVSSTPTPEGRLSIDDLISLRVHGITPEYIEGMRKLFGENLTVREVSSLRVQGVTPDYVRDMRAFFNLPLSWRDIVGLRVQGVTPSYVNELRAAGVDVNNARDATSLRVQGVTPAFVRSLRDAGYDKISVRDLTRLAAAGVNADFIREMSKYKTEKSKDKR